MGTLYEDPRILLRIRNVSKMKVVEKIKRHILCSIIFFFSKNRAINEIMGSSKHQMSGIDDGI